MVEKVGLTTPQTTSDITTSEGLGAGSFGNPYLPQDSSGALEKDITKTSALLDIVTDTSQLEEPEQVDLGPQVLFSPSTKKMFVNGATFDVDDYQSALDAKQFLTQPTAPAPVDVAEDWVRVSPDTFTKYIQDIKNPSLGRLASKNFDIGVDNLKLLAGRGLQFYGKEETGKEWVDEALADLYKNQPFQREFQNESGEFVSNGLVDWFVANLAQQGPMILESIGVALVGGVAGGLAGGGANPFTALGGSLSALMGKESFKQGVLAAAKKYSKNQPMTVGEKKLLREVSGLAGATKVKNDVFYNNPFTGAKNRAARDEALEYTGAKIAGKAGATQARIGGAAGFSILGAQQLGQADIYGEVRETGVGDRGTAFLGSFPYAAAEVIPEFFLAGKVLGLNPAKMRTGADVLKRGPKSIFRRAGEGIVVGGALEGATELAQESILLGGTDQLGDAGTYRRLLNAFAAGFAIGGPIGGIANLKTDKAADVLNPEGNKDPEPETTSQKPPEPDETGQLPLFGPEVTSRTRDTRRNPTGVPQPEPIETPQPTQLDIFGGEEIIPTQPEVETDPNQLELDLAGQQQPTVTGQQSLLTPTGRARNRRRQQAAAAGATGAAATAGPSASNLQVSDPIGSPALVPNPVLQQVQQNRQPPVQTTGQVSDPISSPIPAPNPILQTVQQTGQPEVKPETDINNDLYKLKTGRTISTFNQQDLLDQRDRLIRKKKLTKKEDKDLQAVTAAISRREAAMATGAAAGVEAENRLQKIVNKEKEIQEDNKRNAAILRKAEREERERIRKAEEKLEAERIKQAEAQTKILENQAAATTAATTEGETQDAIQEQKTNEVVTGEQARGSGAVPEGDQQAADVNTAEQGQEDQGQAQTGSQNQEQKTKADSLKRGRENISEQVQESTNRARENRVVTPVKSKATRDPATIWASLGTALTYDNLSPELQEQFQNDPSFTRADEPNIGKLRNKYMSLAQAEVEANRNIGSNSEILLDAQAQIEGLQGETTADVDALTDAIADMMEIAFGAENPNPNKPQALLKGKSERKFVKDFLLNTQFTDQQIDIIRQEFISSIIAQERRDMQTGGVEADWVVVAEKLGAMNTILNTDTLSVRNKVARYKAAQEPVTDTIGATEQEATDLNEEKATQELTDMINNYISEKHYITKTTNRTGEKISKIRKMETLYASANKEAIVQGVPLKDYFDKDGNLNLVQSTTESGMKVRKPAPINNKQTAPTVNDIVNEADGKDGKYYRYTDGQEIKDPVPKGKAELIVKQILRKLKTKPTVTVVKNREELQETNPALYKRATEARDDFDTVNASGYSFGDQIIIFTDFVKDEQMLRSIIGHEALGHFGFRAFLPMNRLKLVFDDIYNSDPAIRLIADMNINNGQEKYEAIEEALADHAAYVDSHILARFWNAIKNFMRDAFGIEFQDDMTRYLIFQARRNLRTGGSGVVTVKQMMENMNRLRNESKYGRYFVETHSTVAAKGLTSMAQRLTSKPGNLFNYKEYYDGAKKIGRRMYGQGDASGWFGRVLEEFQTLDNVALRSEGLSKIFALFQGQTARTRKYQQIYGDMTKFTHSANYSGLFGQNGPTAQELEIAGKLLAFGALFKSGQINSDADIRNAPSLITKDGEGNPIIDMAAFEKMKADNIISKETFEQGFDVQLDFLEDGTPNPDGRPFRFEPGAISDRVYRIYQENRNAVDEAAKDLLESNLEATVSETTDILQMVREYAEDSRGIGASAQDVAAARTILNKYKEIYSEGATLEGVGIKYDPEAQDKAERFIRDVNRALWEPKKLEDWVSGNTTEVPVLQDGSEQFTDVVNSLQQLHEIYNNKKADAKTVTETIQNLLILDLKNTNNEFNAKRTVLGGYVPFTRRGKFQVTLRAFDNDGNEVELADHTKNVLPYYQVATQEDARALEKELTEDFGGTNYKFIDNNLQEVEVTLEARTAAVSKSAPVSSEMNLNEFTSIMARIGINLKPEQQKKIITALTKQSDRARKSLQRSGTAGWDADVVRSVSEHLETMSHAAGKTFYSHKLNKYTTDVKLWSKGNKKKLNRLRENMERVEQTGNDEQIQIAQQQYDAYANQYRYSAEKGETITVFKGSGRGRESIQVATEGEGNRYKDIASGLLDFYGRAGNIDVSTEDMLSGEAGSAIKLLTVTTQLGGSLATGLINTMSMVTHSIPYLSTYNAKTGYGGGFGLGRSASAMTMALRNMKNFNLENLSHVQKVIDDKALQNKYGITQDEAQVLLEATEQGVLQAAQFNALVGTARGGLMAKKQLAAGVRAWMKIFSYTEQLNRRTTFLAAYRLQRDKLQAAGQSLKEASKNAEEFAIRAVNTSQGEYGMFNRPQMARGNVLQYIFMYKQFVIITVELIKNLAPKERLMLLGMLVFLSGLKGLPFADDITDLIDTLVQARGIKMGTVEKELTEFIEELAPGASPIAMRGLLDYTLGATISTRLGFGDLVPLTGLGKAGSDNWQEVKNFFGPVYSAAEQTVVTANLVARQGAEAIGLKDDTTTWSDIFKNQPFGALRGVTDGISYMANGHITNKQGKILQEDVSGLQIFFRFLNFYPAGATYQNDIIRMSKQTDGYVKAIKKGYTDAWVKAKLVGDRDRMRQVERDVREHNQDHRGTEFELKRWLPSAQRAYRAWSLPAAERYKKFAPKNIRPDTQFLLDAYEDAIDNH